MRRTAIADIEGAVKSAIFAAIIAVSMLAPTGARAQEIDNLIKQARQQTDDYRREIIREGPCEGKYPPIPSGSLIVPEEALTRIDPAVLDDKIHQLNAEIQNAQTTLRTIKVAQRDAVSDWLSRQYGSRIGEPVEFMVDDRIYVITPWLFGTFVENYPSQIRANQGRKVEVTFTPAVFSAGLRPYMKIRPSAYGGAAIPGTLEFMPRDVSGTSNERFQMGQWEDVDPNRPIKWTWEAKPSSEFKGADFDVIMEAQQPGQMRGTQEAAELPIKIGLEPERSFLEKHDALMSGIVSALLTALAGTFFANWWGKSRP